MTTFERIRALYAHVAAGSDHLASWQVRSERDVFHWAAGFVAGVAGPMGLAYAYLSLRKQAADDNDLAAVKDARIDARFSVSGVACGGLVGLVAPFVACGWPGVLATWLAATAAVALMIVASVRARA
jgi:hypothetical protein